MKVRRAAVLLAAAAVLVAAPGGPSGAGAGGCARPARAASAVPDPRFEEAFARYGNDNTSLDDWTGGDSTYSTPLPDGRVVWIFSDTYLGLVRADGTRPYTAPLVNNTFVLQEGVRLTSTLHGGTAEDPDALVAPDERRSWYWMGDGTVEGDRLRVFALKFTRTGPGQWDWHWSGTDLATFALPGLELLGTTPVVSSNGVTYGSAVMEDGSLTYVYGVEDTGLAKYMHLARARRGAVAGPWQFWTGNGWSQDPARSGRILWGVGNEYSVTPWGGGYLLITMDTRVPFTPAVVAYGACDPTGPWAGPFHVYATPESGGDIFTYNAHAHPEFNDRSGLLVTYNVNSFDALDNYRDVTIYRPRFIRVRVGP